MHELSIIHSIISASSEAIADAERGYRIESIDLEIGDLAGIEISSIEFLWDAAVEGTVLEGAERNLIRIPGSAECLDCNTVFPLAQHYDPCPACGSYFKQIRQGEDLRIKSLTLTKPDEISMPEFPPLSDN